MRKILNFWQSVVLRARSSYKIIAAFIFSILTSWLIKDGLTQALFPGKSFGGRNFLFQSGIFTLYTLVFFLSYLLLFVILCSLFPKTAFRYKLKLDLSRKIVKEDNKTRIFLALLILCLGIGGIFFVNNVLSSIDTHTWMYRPIDIIPAMDPAGIDFRICVYRQPMIMFFGAQDTAAIACKNNFPPLVNLVTMPFLLIGENSAYLVQIGLLFLSNTTSLLMAAWMAKKYFFSDLGFQEMTAGLIALFIFSAVLFYTLSSYSFMFSIERGNFDIFTIVFALAAIICLLKFSQNIWLPVIFLSIATHLKIYPGILFVPLFLKHGKKMIFPAILVNVVFLFILGTQNAFEFLQGVFSKTMITAQAFVWVGNHSAYSFAEIIADKFNIIQPSSLILLSRVFFLTPIILWCLAAFALFRQKFSERNALLWVMVSIPLMDIIPSISNDYKLVILNPAVIFLVALLIRNLVRKYSLVDFIQLGLVMLILLFLGRSYVFFNPTETLISNKYLWSLSLEVLIVFNIFKNYFFEERIERLAEI